LFDEDEIKILKNLSKKNFINSFIMRSCDG